MWRYASSANALIIFSAVEDLILDNTLIIRKNNSPSALHTFSAYNRKMKAPWGKLPTSSVGFS